jgi:hypothetical protein
MWSKTDTLDGLGLRSPALRAEREPIHSSCRLPLGLVMGDPLPCSARCEELFPLRAGGLALGGGTVDILGPDPEDRCEGVPRRPDQEVGVVREEHPGIDGAGPRLRQSGQTDHEVGPVRVVREDDTAPSPRTMTW